MGKTVIRTVSVYEVIDAYSETLLGYSVSASENFDAQFAAFRMAIETAGCKPYEIVTDNQGGQRSKIAQKFFANICRINRPTAPYNGPSKSIESAFGRFQQQVLHEDWRFTGGNISSKEAWKINREFLEANKEKLFTYEEMLAAYAAARRKWNAMKHYRTGIAHEEMYRASVNPATDPVTEFDMIDLFWLTTEQPSLFTADGITIQYRNRKYTYEVLTADGRPDYEWRRDNTGREFFVKFDPQRMDRALLYTRTPMGLRYETVAYPYLSIRRNIQEQRPGDMELIRFNDDANKRERVRPPDRGARAGAGTRRRSGTARAADSVPQRHQRKRVRAAGRRNGGRTGRGDDRTTCGRRIYESRQQPWISTRRPFSAECKS